MSGCSDVVKLPYKETVRCSLSILLTISFFLTLTIDLAINIQDRNDLSLKEESSNLLIPTKNPDPLCRVIKQCTE